MKTAFGFLSMLILRDHSKWTTNKNERRMLIPKFVLKVINSERKKLTHYEIIDRIAEQTESVITQVCKNENCGFIQTYDDHVSHLLIHLNSLINCKIGFP